MIITIFFLEAVIAAVLVCSLTPVAWYWGFLIALGAFVGLNVAYLVFAYFFSLCLGKGENKREHPHIRRMTVRSVGWILNVLNIGFTIEGREKLPRDPVVLVSNHRSDFDPMVTMVALSRRKLAYISKESNLKIPLAGAFVRRCWFLPIDRENPRKALRTLRHGADLIRQGHDMGIYPEGTRSREGGLLPFKEGAFMMAKWADAPVAVMTTEGTERIAGHVVFRRNRVKLRIVEVIPREDVAAMSVVELTHRAESLLRDALGEPPLASVQHSGDAEENNKNT